MSKGSGTGGSSGGGSSRGASANNEKSNLSLTGRRTLSGNAVTKLISALGGVSRLPTKSISKVSRKIRVEKKSKDQVSSKSEIGTKSKNQVHVKIQVSHAYRNLTSRGGGPEIVLTGGADYAKSEKLNGAKTVRAEVTQIGKRGKRTVWVGDVKL